MTIKEEIESRRAALKSKKPVSAISYSSWPLWAKALRKFAKDGDRGIGDVIARIIGPETSDSFKLWYRTIFGKSCGCTGRQMRWNQMYRV